jgi:hypothetical protein
MNLFVSACHVVTADGFMLPCRFIHQTAELQLMAAAQALLRLAPKLPSLHGWATGEEVPGAFQLAVHKMLRAGSGLRPTIDQ